MCGNPPPWKEKSSQAVPPAGHPAALCGEQHSNYIDFHLAGQVKVVEKPLFQGKIPSETTDAHACGKVDAAEWQPARGAAARSASLIKKAFLNFYILNLKIFFHKILRYPSYPHFHIVTIHVSTFCGNVVDNPLFWAYFIHKWAFSALFVLLYNSGILIKKKVIHNLINIFP